MAFPSNPGYQGSFLRCLSIVFFYPGKLERIVWRRLRRAYHPLEQVFKAHSCKGGPQLISCRQPYLMHRTLRLGAATVWPDDAVVEIDLANHGFDYLQQGNVSRFLGENKAAASALAYFDETRLGKLLCYFGQKMSRNIRALSYFLAADQLSLSFVAQIEHAADCVFTSSSKSHKH